MKVLPIIFLGLLLSSCASITTGSNQSLSVNTEPDNQASCTLTNDKGSWYINNTPGTVTVNRAFGDMTVICKKDQKTGIVKVKSSCNATNAGNILFGGFIGLAVDAGTGAGYNYPGIIHVPLK
jgi:hypothetical protein